MKPSINQEIRPKFLSFVMLFIALLLLIGGLYTIGVWLPMIGASITLAFTRRKSVTEVYSIKQFQIGCILFALIGVIVLAIFEYNYSLSWFFVAIILSFSFKAVRWVLNIIGIIGLFTNV